LFPSCCPSRSSFPGLIYYFLSLLSFFSLSFLIFIWSLSVVVAWMQVVLVVSRRLVALLLPWGSVFCGIIQGFLWELW
jgi:hypothetical protein